jgi:solute carrier family 25 ornithine transporter 2/15
MFSTTPDSFIMTTGRDVTSAFVGSLFCAYSGQPFDTLKVRLQTPLSSHLSPSIALANMLRTEPPTALWKGVVPTTMGMCVENAVAFGINEQLKR